MIGGTSIVGMQEDDIPHRHLLYGTQNDSFCVFIHTQHFMGINGQQAQTVEVEFTLRLMGRESIALGEAQYLAHFTYRLGTHAQTIIVRIAIDIDLQRNQSLHIDRLWFHIG